MNLISSLIWPGALIAAVGLICLTAARMWGGWLDLRRESLRAESVEEPAGPPSLRIELASVRERLRKLEAIAHGVDL